MLRRLYKEAGGRSIPFMMNLLGEGRKRGPPPRPIRPEESREFDRAGESLAEALAAFKQITTKFKKYAI